MKIEQAKGIIERVFVVDLAGTFASLEKKGIIELLEKGEENEKYKAIVNELEKDWGWCTTFYRGRLPDGGYSGHNESIKEIMDRVKQKYFPEPKKELVKLIQEIDRAVKELLEEVTK